jgi:colanic acid/amylovoran biosynthesis protein
MNVAINGTSTQNRGAELMALAVATRLRDWDPAVRIAVDPWFGSFEDRARYGFRTFNTYPARTASRWCGNFSPRGFRDSIGLIDVSDVDAIIDASGFVFTDAWGSDAAAHLNRTVARCNRAKAKLVLLPQAFGPFTNPALTNECKRLIERADVIYARDPDSLAAIEALGGARDLRVCPDFTLAMRSVVPRALSEWQPFGAVVPNYRMVDKTSPKAGAAYMEFLKEAVRSLQNANLRPIVILHDPGADRHVLPELFASTGKLPVFESCDPLELKGALGLAEVVVGSRFHALVGALSQGVPCIGAGWAHKYKWLFHDFGIPELLVDDLEAFEQLDGLVRTATSPDTRPEIVARVRRSAAKLHEQVESMWFDVRGLLGFSERRPVEDGIALA